MLAGACFSGAFRASYHQHYVTLHPGELYIVISDFPYVGNLKKKQANTPETEVR
jgi:hypothetical protein